MNLLGVRSLHARRQYMGDGPCERGHCTMRIKGAVPQASSITHVVLRVVAARHPPPPPELLTQRFGRYPELLTQHSGKFPELLTSHFTQHSSRYLKLLADHSSRYPELPTQRSSRNPKRTSYPDVIESPTLPVCRCAPAAIWKRERGTTLKRLDSIGVVSKKRCCGIVD